MNCRSCPRRRGALNAGRKAAILGLSQDSFFAALRQGGLLLGRHQRHLVMGGCVLRTAGGPVTALFCGPGERVGSRQIVDGNTSLRCGPVVHLALDESGLPRAGAEGSVIVFVLMSF